MGTRLSYLTEAGKAAIYQKIGAGNLSSHGFIPKHFWPRFLQPFICGKKFNEQRINHTRHRRVAVNHQRSAATN